MLADVERHAGRRPSWFVRESISQVRFASYNLMFSTGEENLCKKCG